MSVCFQAKYKWTLKDIMACLKVCTILSSAANMKYQFLIKNIKQENINSFTSVWRKFGIAPVVARELDKKNSELTSLNEWADSVSLSHYRSSSMHQTVLSISGHWEKNVLNQRLFRLPLWETSSSCGSTQLSTWFMEMWAISRPAPQSSPDELLLSALVTVVCFPRRPIFIQADKLNLPCFEEAIFPPLFHRWPARQLSEMWDWHRWMNLSELFGRLRWVISSLLMEVECHNA